MTGDELMVYRKDRPKNPTTEATPQAPPPTCQLAKEESPYGLK